MSRLVQFLIALAAFGFSLYLLGETLDYKRHGVPADGVVVANVHKLDSDGDHQQAPIVEFTPTGAAAPVQFKSSVSTGWLTGYSKGAHVRVLYLARDPERNARIDSFSENWFAPIALVVFAVFALLGKLERSDDDERWRYRWFWVDWL